nr:immunoglobulin heavy chain junction region [Mus musculus]
CARGGLRGYYFDYW